ncbi:lipid-A-disaccharide synthase [Ranunculus cassubicifolius]
MEDIAVMGIWELLPHLSNIKEKLKVTTESALSFRPDVVVTVDSKGYSLRLLKRLQARHSRGELEKPLHVHYVAQSFWAWKGGEVRLKGLTEFVDHVMLYFHSRKKFVDQMDFLRLMLVIPYWKML